MQEKTDKTVWLRLGLIVILLPVGLLFPLIWIFVGFLAWTIYEGLQPSKYPHVPPPTTWRDVKTEDDSWLILYCEGCESPAEVKFLVAIVREFDLKPNKGVLNSPLLTLEMQVEVGRYRFDFLANGSLVIEVDGATYHSSVEQVERDRIRDEYCIQCGYRVLRIPASVVFQTPQEAMRLVKGALIDIPNFTKPQRIKVTTEKKTIGQHVAAFTKGFDDVMQNANVMSLTNKAVAGYELAIEREQVILDAMVQHAEIAQRSFERSQETLPLLARNAYTKVYGKPSAKLAADTRPLFDIFEWKISIPPLSDNSKVQQIVDARYGYALEQRKERFQVLKERCIRDPIFGYHFLIVTPVM